MSPKRSHILVSCLLLAIITSAVYTRVKNNPFVNFDDGGYVTHNVHVRAGLTWNTFLWAWTSTEVSNWHPLTWISHEVDVSLYGLNPAGHHLTSVAIHVFNVLLLFLLLWRVTGQLGRSLFVAALFALHPLNVESVAWVAERKNVLSTLFFLLTLGAYGWYASKPNIRRYLAVAALFALSLLAKPMTITLPFVLLLLDFWPLERIQGWESAEVAQNQRKNRKAQKVTREPEMVFPVSRTSLFRLVLEKLPLLGLSVGSAIVTVFAQQSANSIQSFTKLPVDIRVENAICAYVMYVWKAFWPSGLCVYYPLLAVYYPVRELGIEGWQVGLALLFLLTVTAVVWQQRFTRRYLVTGWFWYLGTLVPVIGIIQVGDQRMADRYAYLTLIGIFVMVAWGIGEWVDSRKLNLRMVTAVAAALIAVLSVLTWKQIGYWKSSYDLWARTLSVTRNNLLANINFGDALRESGRPQEALSCFERAVTLNPPDPNIHVKVAVALVESGRVEEAISEYQTAIHLTPDPSIVGPSFESIAALYTSLGDYSKVRESYKQALETDARMGPVMIRHLSDWVAHQPTAGGYVSLGLLLQETGDISRAREAYRRALKVDPTFVSAKELLENAGG